jgi:hypothetical protein
MVELYLHSPIRLHGVVLNQLNTGTTFIASGTYSNNGTLKGYPIQMIN